MPPAISDDEASDAGDVVTPIATKNGDHAFDDQEPAAVAGDVNDEEQEDADEKAEEGDENEDEDMDEDEFVVEQIVGHIYKKGVIKYKVKWEGYSEEEDLTWEDEENLQENASVVLTNYLDSIGGRDKIVGQSKAGAQKKRGRPASTTNTPTNGTKRSKRGDNGGSATPIVGAPSRPWAPPAGSWEDHVASIDACHDDITGKLIVYLSWKNGNKTQHDTKIVYSRCPQKMLMFYEQHVKIVKTQSEAGLE